eukprot:365530-Chlamydomonas_euryale.AAC.25
MSPSGWGRPNWHDLTSDVMPEALPATPTCALPATPTCALPATLTCALPAIPTRVLPATPTCALPAGMVSREDLQIMLKQLAGSSMSEDELKDVIDTVLHKACGPNPRDGIDLAAFKKALLTASLSSMAVQVPSDA